MSMEFRTEQLENSGCTIMYMVRNQLAQGRYLIHSKYKRSAHHIAMLGLTHIVRCHGLVPFVVELERLIR